jgi:hypothetical protein
MNPSSWWLAWRERRREGSEKEISYTSAGTSMANVQQLVLPLRSSGKGADDFGSSNDAVRGIYVLLFSC